MLVCPVCKSKLDIEVEKIEKGEVEEGVFTMHILQ